MERKIIIQGGLGNQMFQYALVLALRSRGFKVKLDTSMYNFMKMHNGFELEKVFAIKEDVVLKNDIHLLWLRIIRKYNLPIILKDTCSFNLLVLKKPALYLNGYWQDERYFNFVQDEVRKVFLFKDIDIQNINLSEEMKSCNSVSLHIRRGDYADYGMTIIDTNYYKKAIKFICQKVYAPIFYIFSDDTIEAKRIADDLDINYKIISHNRGSDAYKDMYLMSKCSYNIIANSSFSWWGAWLNNNPDKIVVAPNVWDSKKINFHPQCEDWILL